MGASFTLISAALIAITATAAARADSDKTLARSQSGLARHHFYSDAKIPSSDLAAVHELAKDYGGSFGTDSYFDAVDSVFRAIRPEVYGGERKPLEAGEKMAQFAKKLETFISKLSSQTVKGAVHFALADAVATLEEFRPEEFHSVDQPGWSGSGAAFVHADESPAYVEGYVENKAPYANHTWGGDTLSDAQLRDGASHNLFPLQYQGQDIRQMQFALGHPKAAAMYLKVARGHNHLRFALVSALYEAGGTAHLEHERRIAKYMRERRKMERWEAMIYVSHASEQELSTLLDEAGIRPSIAAELQAGAGWVPTTCANGGQDQTTRNGQTLDQETDKFVENAIQRNIATTSVRSEQ